MVVVGWLASGACGQALTGGTDAKAHRSCSDIARDYDVALAATLVCDDRTPPCNDLVPPALVPCPVCQILAPQTWGIAAVLQEWFDTGCPTASCPPPVCPEYVTGMCVPTPDGRGMCVTLVMDGGGPGSFDGGPSDGGSSDGGPSDAAVTP